MLLKKILIGIPLVVLAVVGLIGGKMYLEENKIVSIVKSDEANKAVESMLKKIEKNALTPEGNIKSYKIDYSKVKRNPMGGINISIIVNDNEEMIINTTLEKNSRGDYIIDSTAISPELWELTDDGQKEGK